MSGKAELLYGRRAAETVAIGATALDTAADETIVIEDAEILYVLYEMSMQPALENLPVSLHPSVPAVYGMTFIRARNGALGAFELAYTGIACRTGIKPRHFIQAAYSDNAQAATFFAARYGFDCTQAAVKQRETYDRARGTIEHDGNMLLDIAITDCIPLVGAGATIKYSPPLNATRVGGDSTLVQFEAAYDFKRVLRGKPRLGAFDSAALGNAAIRPTHPIAGSFAVCDLHLMPARFQVDLDVPAEAGGARKIAR